MLREEKGSVILGIKIESRGGNSRGQAKGGDIGIRKMKRHRDLETQLWGSLQKDEYSPCPF